VVSCCENGNEHMERNHHGTHLLNLVRVATKIEHYQGDVSGSTSDTARACPRR
jgi:hypothetical protein